MKEDPVKPSAALVYSDEYTRFDYGRGHPLRLFRLQLTVDLMKDYGLLDPPVEITNPPLASEETITTFHTPDYLQALKEAEENAIPKPLYNLGNADNPIFPGMYTLSRMVVGGTVVGIREAIKGKRVFHIGGGMHHARSNGASGFCYLNDIVVALKEAEEQGLRVLYIDIDAHHCDSVQDAFYSSRNILVVSFHQYGPNFYPGTGAETELGEGEGHGYNLNIPLNSYTEDEAFWWAYNQIVPYVMDSFKPDLLFTQLGADSHKDDPLTSLFLTTGSYQRIADDLASRWQGPWMAVGGGGYDIVNVARIWTIFWASILNREIPQELPESFLKIAHIEGFDGPFIHDLPGWTGEPNNIPKSLESRVKFLKEHSPLFR